MVEKLNVKISKTLINKIQKQVEESQGEFKSVEDYIEFVLTELLKEDELEQVYTPEEEEKLKERLRALGYIE